MACFRVHITWYEYLWFAHGSENRKYCVNVLWNLLYTATGFLIFESHCQELMKSWFYVIIVSHAMKVVNQGKERNSLLLVSNNNFTWHGLSPFLFGEVTLFTNNNARPKCTAWVGFKFFNITVYEIHDIEVLWRKTVLDINAMDADELRALMDVQWSNWT